MVRLRHFESVFVLESVKDYKACCTSFERREVVAMSAKHMRESLKFQFGIAWGLLDYHLDGLAEDEVFWQPCPRGISVNKTSEGWSIDWPESESYEVGPPNIAWLMWHIIFWWSMVLDHSFAEGSLQQEDVKWPGTFSEAKQTIEGLREAWLDKLDSLSDVELVSSERSKWPFDGRAFYDLAAWLNLELMKNAAEIGYCRFLYAQGDR
jgi:hypothetical protein